MVRYLSPEWFEEVNEVAPAGGGVGAAGADAPFCVQQIVTGGPDGDVRYWVRFEGGAVEAGLGEIGAPDVTVRQSYDTASAVSSGQLSAHAAIVEGRIRVSGDTTLLLEHQTALQELAAALDPVRRRTTYP